MDEKLKTIERAIDEYNKIVAEYDAELEKGNSPKLADLKRKKEQASYIVQNLIDGK